MLSGGIGAGISCRAVIVQLSVWLDMWQLIIMRVAVTRSIVFAGEFLLRKVVLIMYYIHARQTLDKERQPHQRWYALVVVMMITSFRISKTCLV